VNNKRFAILALGLIAVMALTACGTGGSGAAPLAVTVKAEDIKYDTTALTAKVGQAVTVTLSNGGALDHSFVIDELNVKIENVKPGGTGTATFTPSTAGTYTFYCNVPGHKEAGMVGTLTVTQ
jgi:plastocyanin